MKLNEYLSNLNFKEKVIFFPQLPFLFYKSRIKKVPLYATDLIVPINGQKTVLSLLWRGPENYVPVWFSKIDFKAVLGDEKIFLDIGSNIGLFSAMVFKETKANVYLFEINPSINKLLKRMAKDLDKSKINIFGGGLSNKKCKQNISFDSNFSLMGTLDIDRYKDKNNFKTQGQVQVYTLDSLSKSLLQDKKIGMIKLDVEGWEDKVLMGAKKLLKRDFPQILFEANRPGDFEKCEKILKPIGYKFFKLSETDWLAKI
jgi:FkbM family methyltransferase